MQVLALVGKLPPAFQESKEGEPASVPGDRGKVTFRHWPIGGLVNLTSNVLHTPVVDGTGIRGYYDLELDPAQFAGTARTARDRPPAMPIYSRRHCGSNWGSGWKSGRRRWKLR